MRGMNYWFAVGVKNPRKEHWTFRRFIDMYETGEEGVAREVLEETGLKVEKAAYLFSLPNTYLYSGFLVHTLDQFFLCTVEDATHLEAMDDVADSFWMPLDK